MVDRSVSTRPSPEIQVGHHRASSHRVALQVDENSVETFSEASVVEATLAASVTVKVTVRVEVEVEAEDVEEVEEEEPVAPVLVLVLVLVVVVVLSLVLVLVLVVVDATRLRAKRSALSVLPVRELRKHSDFTRSSNFSFFKMVRKQVSSGSTKDKKEKTKE